VFYFSLLSRNIGIKKTPPVQGTRLFNPFFRYQNAVGQEKLLPLFPGSTRNDPLKVFKRFWSSLTLYLFSVDGNADTARLHSFIHCNLFPISNPKIQRQNSIAIG
jgi:hypothetical protein